MDHNVWYVYRFSRESLTTHLQNAKSGFLHRLVPAVVDKLGDTFPELRAQQTKIVHIVKREEELFMRTLVGGTRKVRCTL